MDIKIMTNLRKNKKNTKVYLFSFSYAHHIIAHTGVELISHLHFSQYYSTKISPLSSRNVINFYVNSSLSPRFNVTLKTINRSFISGA